MGTSDYFNECSSYSSASVPQNFIGCQYPRTGNAYAGFGIGFQGTYSVREYIATPLSDVLVSGKKYCIELYVSLSDSSSYAANRIGVYFSKDSIAYNDWSVPMPFIPQIEEQTIITDTSGWFLIAGQYLANGGEKYIAIGNFRINSNTLIDTVFPTGWQSYGYYYIDDVSLYLCDTTNDNNSTLFIPNTFTPNSDGKNDIFKAEGENISEFHAMIFNRWGELVYEWGDINGSWDGRYKGAPAPDGVYVYKIKVKGSDGVEYNRHGTIAMMK